MKLAKVVRSDIKKLLEYLYEDERKHWEECGKPKKHIFTIIERLENKLDEKEKK